MKIFLTILFITSLSTASSAQVSRHSKPEPKDQGRSVSERQIIDLPLAKRSSKPKLTMQGALKLAESYIATEKIDTSRYYLLEAKYILHGSKDNQEPSWFFWWVNENGAMGDYVEIVVSIKTGDVKRLPSM